MATIEENKAVIQKWSAAVWNNSDFERDNGLDSVLSPKHRVGPAEVKASWKRLHECFNNLRAEIVEMVAEGDRVATHFAVSGSRLGKPSNWTAIYFHRLENGKIVDVCRLRDKPTT